MKKTNPVSLVIKFILFTLLALLLSRLYLVTDHFDRIDSAAAITTILLQGLRVDLVVIGYFYSMPLLISIWLAHTRFSLLIFQILKVWLIASFTTIIFMEVVTPEFIAEYDIRPNRLFIDYLAYPAEVSRMLWEGYKPAILLATLAIAVCLLFAYKQTVRATCVKGQWSWLQKTGISILLVLVGFGMMRSSVQHRPFNPSMVYFSNDNLINSLSLNSIYSVLYAAYNVSSERKASELYGKMDDIQIIEQVRTATDSSVETFVSDNIPTLRYHTASYKGSPRNIVILLQESLGARYVGSLGGENLTPNLDTLMQQGWKFTNAYATGTRSVRGIEAVFTGFSPGPSRSVVKLSKSQSDFFSIASLLQKHNYLTQFIYGGESHFDNMKSFFLGNGIEDIHDLPTFNKPKFVGSWGASDEDLYREAHQQFIELNKQKRPFFSLVFTTSNHSPWDYPSGCIEGSEQNREHAIQYSDCALGKFFAQAKKSDYWENTVFLVVADHDSRAYGTDLVPIDHFRIPALFIGKDIKPRVDNRLISQIDLPTTLLSLAGISDFHPMLGFDLTQKVPENKQRVMMQYGENFAWMNHQFAVVHRPNLPTKIFTHNYQQLLEAKEEKPENALQIITHANSLWSSLAYEKGLYRLPDLAVSELKVVNLKNNTESKHYF